MQEGSSIGKKAAIICTGILLLSAIVQATPPSLAWKRFSPKGGRFSVLLPNKPKTERQSHLIKGIRLSGYAFSAWSRAGAEFTVVYVDAPAPPKADAAEQVLDAASRRCGETKLSAERLTVNDYPARRCRGIEGGLQVDVLSTLVERRLYTLLVVHNRGEDENDVARFFDSFSLNRPNDIKRNP